MNTKRVRKARGTKLNGERSYDLCRGCYSPGCDPMARHPKVEARLRAGHCPACGELWDFCRCHSGLEQKIIVHNNKKKHKYIKIRNQILAIFDTLTAKEFDDEFAERAIYMAKTDFIIMRFSTPETVLKFMSSFSKMQDFSPAKDYAALQSLIMEHLKFANSFKKENAQ